MKKIIVACLVLASTHLMLAQKSNWAKPCGTPPQKSAWLKAYQKNPSAYKVVDSVLYIPVSIHNVGNDDGSGFLSLSTILDAFCVLNRDFEESDIQFYIEGDVRYISETAFNRHDTILDGAYAMLQYNIENTLNTYFVSNPAGNCGYNLPYAGIAMNKSCSGRRSHTWAHEVGHAFSLPHPFIGWEGGISWDNTVPPDYSHPAPERVTINYTGFKDSLITDTLIIDTVLVELVDRSNCDEAADGFCDTEADYLALRWNCNQDGQSAIVQTDPAGTKFRSDGTLIMSYSNDDCVLRFSAGQRAAMRANITDERANLLYNQMPGVAVAADAEVQYIRPIDAEAVTPSQVLLEWEAVPNATSYIVEISRLPGFPVPQRQVVGANVATFENLREEALYYWRVRPYNAYSTCAGWSESQTFTTTSISPVTEVFLGGDFTVQPNPALAGTAVTLKTYFSRKPEDAYLQVSAASGVVIFKKSIDINVGRQVIPLEWKQGVVPGFYMITLYADGYNKTKRIVIQ